MIILPFGMEENSGKENEKGICDLVILINTEWIDETPQEHTMCMRHQYSTKMRK